MLKDELTYWWCLDDIIKGCWIEGNWKMCHGDLLVP
jgi:hypothetical protein